MTIQFRRRVVVRIDWRARFRATVADLLGEVPQLPCRYCQAQPGEWCEYDCGSPFPVLHPENRAALDAR